MTEVQLAPSQDGGRDRIRHRIHHCQPWLLFVLTLCYTILPCSSEIRVYSGTLSADSAYVHYAEGYLIAPGYVDVSGLNFSASGAKSSYDDDNHGSGMAKGTGNSTLKNTIQGGNDDSLTGGGGIRRRGRTMDDVTLKSTTVDVVFFRLPPSCSSSASGCDWTTFGVGSSRTDNKTGQQFVQWCCSNEAIKSGYCKSGADSYGRLIIDGKKFTGQHRFLEVPTNGTWQGTVKYGKFEVAKDSGRYILILANCNDEGRDVSVAGKYVWKSRHGFLPGELFDEMYFCLVLTIIYFSVMLWYGIGMRTYSDASIPIQKWILGTMVMGLLEEFFRTGDYFVWNEDGSKFWLAVYTGVSLGVLKRGISRCLIVMVSLGWGVVHDTLGKTLYWIVILGTLYVGISGAQDILTVVAVEDIQKLSTSQEYEIFNEVVILSFIVAAIDVTFYMWILDALNNTMNYLEARHQNSKLLRYLRLRCILLFSILFAVVWSVYGIVNNYSEDGLLEEEQQWVAKAGMEVNYLFVLIGVAILWRPNPNAKEYAFVMELPSLGAGDDDDEDGRDLELTPTDIPSANDDDDDDNEAERPKDSFQYRDQNNGHSLPDIQ